MSYRILAVAKRLVAERSAKTLNALINGQRLVSSNVARTLSAAVQSKQLIAEVVKGFYLDRKELLESLAITQFIKRHIDKTLNDESVLQDEHSYSFGKQLNDDTSVIDQPSIESGKSISDDSSLNDLTVLEVEKRLQEDQFSVLDKLTYVTGFQKFEFLSLTDVIEKQQLKQLDDSYSVTDQYSDAFSKIRSDSLSLNDSYSGSLNKALADRIYATDDLDGETSIEDDQEIEFTKVKNNILGIVDVFDRTVEFTRQFSDQSQVSDLPSKNYQPAKAEQASVSDAFDLVPNKGLLETITIVELTSFAIQRQLQDAASISDVYAPLFTRPVQDSGNVVDSQVKLVGKQPSESASVDDSGSLISQGYTVDNTYFADDYVGDKRTFT